MKKHKILITGATGFLGKHLAWCLSKTKHEIYLTAAHEDINSGVYKLDLTNINQMKKKIKEIRPTIVYHIGAVVNLTRDFEIAKKCFQINLFGTLNLLEALKNSPPKKFIFTSTEEVYGKGKIPYKENQLCFPPSPYAVSKIAAEDLCKIYAQDLNFSLIIFRIGTMYGPENHKLRFISQIINNAINNEDIYLNSGHKKRDYVYVKDVVDALILAKELNMSKSCEIINLGGGTSYRLIDLVKTVITLTKSKSKILVGKIPERKYESSEWLLDISKAEKLLNWYPKISLEKGLREIIEYHKSN